MDTEATKLIEENLNFPDDDHRDASAVDGDAEDNTTTVDCSSDDKARVSQVVRVTTTRPGPAVAGGSAAAVVNVVPKNSRRTRCRAAGKKQENCRKRGGGGGVAAGGVRPGGGGQQRKRRRGKTKRNRNQGGGNNSSMDKKSVNWRLADQDHSHMINMSIPPYPPVPYNTNRFLMEYHMAEVQDSGSPAVNRDEFLTNEFSTVYETAKCERLEGLTKQQLIQEYLQLEESYDQLRSSSKAAAASGTGVGRTTAHNNHTNKVKWEAHWRALKDQVRRLNAENHGEF